MNRQMGRLATSFLIAGCLLGVRSISTDAQIPLVQIRLGNEPDEWSVTYCKPPYTIDTLEVVAFNLNMWLAAADLKIVYPPAISFMEDIIDADLWLGTSDVGIAMTWQTPKNAFSPVEILRARVIWTAMCDCDSRNPQQVVDIQGYFGNPNPHVVRWPDYAEFQLAGFYSLICKDPPVPVRSVTWGAIKALYR